MGNGTTLYGFLSRAEMGPRGSLACQVADQLRRAIVTFHFAPGTMLDKGEICARLGVSRSPVSEAFARLESEGLLEIIPQRGSIVSYISLAAVKEYIFIRKALEAETVRLLAHECPHGLIETLNENIEGQRESLRDGDAAAYHVFDLAFHEGLTGALAYKRMKAMVDTARCNLDRARRITNTMQRMAEGLEEHVRIIKAIATGDAIEAARQMQIHLDAIILEVEHLAARRPELFAPQPPEPPPTIRDLATIRRVPSA